MSKIDLFKQESRIILEHFIIGTAIKNCFDSLEKERFYNEQLEQRIGRDAYVTMMVNKTEHYTGRNTSTISTHCYRYIRVSEPKATARGRRGGDAVTGMHCASLPEAMCRLEMETDTDTERDRLEQRQRLRLTSNSNCFMNYM